MAVKGESVDGNSIESRLAVLRNALQAQGLSGAVLARPEHIFYFSGVLPGPSPVFLLVSPEDTVAVAPFPIEACETFTYTDYDIHTGWSVTDNAGKALELALARCPFQAQSVGLETSHFPAVFLPVVQERTGAFRDIAQELWWMRRVKDAGEIACIERNVSGNDRVFAALKEAIQPGMTELDLWAEVQRTLCQNAGEPVVLEADLGAGVRASNPDVKPTLAVLKPGDAVLVDVYSRTQGYYADTTRVFVLGEPAQQQREVHDVLAAALAAGEALLRPGVRACDVDRVVRGLITHRGYAAYFPHHTGHAYGLFQQEKPYLIPAETMPLESGMIVTLEPGIYSSGWGGMRLEGNYLITGTGARRLDHFPSELIVCG